ncbi:MAG: PGPGW domain-containing protein [Beutenbergiaceae bacterium]
MTKTARSIALEVLGWVLVVAGLAALVLPGPGLLMVFSGMVILSQRYEWAEKRLRPLEIRAMRGAARSVATWPRVALSFLFSACIIATGVVWFIRPPAPQWWPLAEHWWLLGGRGTGTTLMLSGLIAIGLVVWSIRRFHGKPEAVAAIDDLAKRT